MPAEEADFEPPLTKSSVEILTAEVSPWARRQCLVMVKEELPDSSDVTIFAMSGKNIRKPVLLHHFLPDVVTLVKDPETGRELAQAYRLEILARGPTGVYSLNDDDWVFKLASAKKIRAHGT